MKKIFLILPLFFICIIGSTRVFAQGETDAYNMSRRELRGTARFSSMAGAFAALGGDASSVERNPAGLGVYRSSELTLSWGGNANFITTEWYGDKKKEKNFGFMPLQMSLILSLKSPGYSDFTYNFGFASNSVYSSKIRFTHTNNTPTDFSLADFTAAGTDPLLQGKDLTYGKYGYDPYAENISWLSILGYNAGWILPPGKFGNPFQSAFVYPNKAGERVLFGPLSNTFLFEEKQKVSESDFSFGVNYAERLYLGLSMKVTHVRYNLTSLYGEDFFEGDFLNLKNNLMAEGIGMGASLGIIGRPNDFLRLGLAVHTGNYIQMEERYYASADSRYSFGLNDKGEYLPKEDWYYSGETPEDAYNKYLVSTPMRFVFGIASTFGKKGLLSLDYEIKPFGMMALKSDSGRPFSILNSVIKDHYTVQHTIRVGGEIRPTSLLSLRAGYMFDSSPIKSRVKEIDERGACKTTVMTVGTYPHYTLPDYSQAFTGGLGFRFSHFYLDLSLVYQVHKSKTYLFPTLYDDNFSNAVVYGPKPINLTHGSMDMNFTLGCKF